MNITAVTPQAKYYDYDKIMIIGMDIIYSHCDSYAINSSSNGSISLSNGVEKQ